MAKVEYSRTRCGVCEEENGTICFPSNIGLAAHEECYKLAGAFTEFYSRARRMCGMLYDDNPTRKANEFHSVAVSNAVNFVRAKGAKTLHEYLSAGEENKKTLYDFVVEGEFDALCSGPKKYMELGNAFRLGTGDDGER